MEWGPFLSGIVTGLVSMVMFHLLHKKLNAWIRALISIGFVALIALIIRLATGPIEY